MEEIEWWEFDTVEELAEQVAGDIGFVVESAAEGHGGARIALPGRELPQPLYKALMTAKALDWSRVTIVPTHEVSGQSKALTAMFGPKKATILDLDGGAPDVNARLAELHWPLDLALLTVGEDGSVAGIVPDNLDAALTAPRGRHAVASGQGVSLTAGAIASARASMIVLTGAQQRETVERALKDGPLSSLPIGRVLAEIDTAVDIFWSAE